jgi:hypothetical protein
VKPRRLNQVVAVVPEKKKLAVDLLTEAYHIAQKPDLFAGISRVYTPKVDGETKPSENKKPQFSAKDLFKKVESSLIEMFNGVAVQDFTNCLAKASVVFKGKVVLEGAPVSYLLFLEKQLTNLKNFVEKLPVRDSSEDWSYQAASALHVTPLTRTQVTSKVQEAIVLYPHSPEHPAQTQLITKDVVTGFWDTRKISGAIAKQDQDAMLDNVRVLSEAVKLAREEANNIEVSVVNPGTAIMDCVFGDIFTRTPPSPEAAPQATA